MNLTFLLVILIQVELMLNDHREDSSELLRKKRYEAGRYLMEDEFQFLMAIVRFGKLVCHATLLTPFWILSSEHCLKKRGRVEFHKTQLYIEKVLTHGEIAIGYLNEPVFNRSRVCLPMYPFNFTNYPCLGLGRGGSRRLHSTAQKLPMKILPQEDCNRLKRAATTEHMHTDAICARSAREGTSVLDVPLGGPCSGDGGGPLVCKVGDSWYQAGILVDEGQYCHGEPGLYIETSGEDNIDWLIEHANYEFISHCSHLPLESSGHNVSVSLALILVAIFISLIV